MMQASKKRVGYRYRVVNLNKKYKINTNFVKKLISEVLKYIKRAQDTELEVVFVADKEIKVLNKKYRKEDSPTDVLSFKIDRKEFGSNLFLGEIFISLDTAFKNCALFGTEFEKEITLYVIHGVLHLFGYDDEDQKNKKKMFKRQEQILGCICKNEDLSKVLMPR